MIRATTPTHIFTLPFEANLLKTVLISYGQYGNEKVKKETKECTLSGKTITVKLTQEETAKFAGGIPVDIQLRAVTTSGDVVATKYYTVECDRVMNDEVLT